jgi:hypothetical protein
MIEKLAAVSIAMIMAGLPWEAGSGNREGPASPYLDSHILQCKAALHRSRVTWIDRLKAGRCGAWRDGRD